MMTSLPRSLSPAPSLPPLFSLLPRLPLLPPLSPSTLSSGLSLLSYSETMGDFLFASDLTNTSATFEVARAHTRVLRWLALTQRLMAGPGWEAVAAAVP
eukprot:443605-Rhodomonas_salina.1